MRFVACLWLLAGGSTAALPTPSSVALNVTGDIALWDRLFAGARHLEVVASGLQWSEGPLWVDGVGLLFTDTISAKLHHLKPSTSGGAFDTTTLLECAGGLCVGDDEAESWRAEPGANGVRGRVPARHRAVGVH